MDDSGIMAAGAQSAQLPSWVMNRANVGQDKSFVDLAGQEAIVDRKLDETGQNAITRSKGWDVLGNIIGFNTRRDWEDAKSSIDAQQETLLQQEAEAQRQMELKAAAEIKARNETIDGEMERFNSQLTTYVPQSKEDEAYHNNIKIEGESALALMRSDDPELREAGAKRYAQIQEDFRGASQKNEAERTQQAELDRQFAESKRKNDLAHQESVQARKDNLAIAAEQKSFDRKQNVVNNAYTQTIKPREEIQQPILNIRNAIALAREKGDLTALYAAGIGVAKLLDPGSVVRESEYKTLVGQGSLSERVEAARVAVVGLPTEANIKKLEDLTDQLEAAANEQYERGMERQRNTATSLGVDPSVLDTVGVDTGSTKRGRDMLNDLAVQRKIDEGGEMGKNFGSLAVLGENINALPVVSDVVGALKRVGR